jgi:hypothetical protein
MSHFSLLPFLFPILGKITDLFILSKELLTIPVSLTPRVDPVRPCQRKNAVLTRIENENGRAGLAVNG